MQIHTHLWRRRKTHLHCSFSTVKANQSFGTDVRLLAHGPFDGGPSECLWGVGRVGWGVGVGVLSIKVLLKCHKGKSTTFVQYPGRECSKFGLSTHEPHQEKSVGAILRSDQQQHVAFSLWLCLDLLSRKLVTWKDKNNKKKHQKYCVTSTMINVTQVVIYHERCVNEPGLGCYI